MDEDDDDLYGTVGTTLSQNGGHQYLNLQANGAPLIKAEELEDGEEEGEEIEEDSDSDIDIITERKPAIRESTTTQPAQRLEILKNENDGTPSVERPLSRAQARPIKSEPIPRTIAPPKPGSQYPEVHTSTIDVNGNPVYEPAGKPVTELDFDADLAEHEKPWRRPGSDQSEYFNYGFDEFTWATYCLKQKSMRDAISAQKAESASFEMMFGGAPGMPSMGMGGPIPGPGPTSAAVQVPQQQAISQQQRASQSVPQDPAAHMGGPMPGMPGMPGMPVMPGMADMSPEMMNAMMQQMMQSRVDPSQMDFGSFVQQFQQMQGGGMDAGMMGNTQQQNFGGSTQGGFGTGGGGGGRRGRRW